MTAKEVANFYGYAKLAAMLPDAARAALSKDALIAQAKDAKGQTVAKAKFQLAPFIAIAGFFVHYLDIYTDFALMMKFGNIHFPYFGASIISSPDGMNVQCAEMGEDYEFACSEYKEPNFFNLSIIFLVMGVIATYGAVDIWNLQARAALQNGELDANELRETLVLLASYAGYPNVAGLVGETEGVIAAWESEQQATND